MTTIDEPQHENRATDICRRLTMLLIDQIGLRVTSDERGVFTLDVPEEQQESLGRGAKLEFAFDRARIDTTDDHPTELVTPDGHLANWLFAQLEELGRPLYTVPRDQTTQVHELSERLFAAYEVEQGQVQLAGCAMEDRLFARLTFRRPTGSSNSDDRLIDVFVDDHGAIINSAQITALGLDDVEGIAKPPEIIGPNQVALLAQAGQKHLDGSGELIAKALVWCKYCRGKLRFTIGNASAELPFEGWAETLEAPPFVCPETGKESFHIVATADDQVTVAEAVETCAVSGSHVLGEMLEVCAVSGQRALPEHFIDCPVTHGRLLRNELIICPACAQAVSPRCIASEHCEACWPMPAVNKDDPRMARILDEHPGLDRWRNWHLRETDSWYLLEARALVRRLLVVVATDTLEPLHLASGNRFGRSWTPIDAARYEEFLR